MKILLTHTPQMRRDYYGTRSLKGLQALGDVLLHEGDEALDAAALVAAAKDADIVVADRKTEGPSEIFGKLPKLRAFVRCAVDIRNIDVEAATKQGILVTQAGPGFQKSVSEMAIGYMIDLSRHISRATADYHAGKMPDIVMGRQLAGSTVGIMGYGSIGRHLAPILKVMGMTVLVSDPYAQVDDRRLHARSADVDSNERTCADLRGHLQMNLPARRLASRPWRGSRTTHSWVTGGRPHSSPVAAPSIGFACRVSIPAEDIC